MPLRLTDDGQRALRERAAVEGASMQDVARRAIRDYVERSRHRDRVASAATTRVLPKPDVKGAQWSMETGPSSPGSISLVVHVLPPPVVPEPPVVPAPPHVVAPPPVVAPAPESTPMVATMGFPVVAGSRGGPSGSLEHPTVAPRHAARTPRSKIALRFIRQAP